MTLLVDMNLSPEWVPAFEEAGLRARHWSDVGAVDALDEVIFQWAAEHDSVIVTQDFDFPHLLYHCHSGKPSVVHLRLRDELDESQRQRVVIAVRNHVNELRHGALLMVTDSRCKLRLLPLAE